MVRYIELDALVVEIEKLKAELHPNFYEYDYDAAKAEILEKIESIIITLKVKDLKDERMKNCPYRVVGCEKYLGTVTKCNGACAWVVDYLKLKELNTKKGE